MESFNQYMKDFLLMQQKAMGFMYENTPTPVSITNDFDKFVKNSIEFHLAAQDYHKSIVKMLESMKNISDIYKIKP
jgi:hypothetical protein